MDHFRQIEQVDSTGIIWFDPRNEPFDLVGFEWIREDKIYRRLPVNPDWPIREAVDKLADHTAGGQVRFRTNSRKILVKVELLERSGMYHMPATGQSGFDLYVIESGNQRYVKTTRFSQDEDQYQADLYNTDIKELRTFTLNFPLYNGVRSVYIGLEEDAVLEKPPPFGHTGKFVIYGTSITQGGCVSRPGMAYSNILSRKLDAQFVNLGFSGNGRGEPELARIISQIPDISFILLDYEANANTEIVNTLAPFIDILREGYPSVPILVISKIRYASAMKGSKAYQSLMILRDFQKDLVAQRMKTGDKNIFFLDGSEILGEDFDECTVDGVHPSDLGSKRIADVLLKTIQEILNN
jgi:hypothetical protein